MLTSSLRQNLRKGAKAFIVHSPLSIFFPSRLGTSCSISELRQDEESSPTLRARRPPRKLTHPQPLPSENMLPVDLVFLYFLSFRFRVHLGVFWRTFRILGGVLKLVPATVKTVGELLESRGALGTTHRLLGLDRQICSTIFKN